MNSNIPEAAPCLHVAKAGADPPSCGFAALKIAVSEPQVLISLSVPSSKAV